MGENSTAELSETDLDFLKDFMNISEVLMFNRGADDGINSNISSNINTSDIAIVPAQDGKGDIQLSMDLDTRDETFDFLGVVIFVVCGHFFIKWFLAFFPCLTNCLVPRSNPVRSLKFLYLLFSNLVLYSCLW